MDLPSSNEESHFISVEGSSDESHVRKKPKKTSSVRFAPGVTSIKPRIFAKDSDLDLETLTEEDIKTEICSCLPSNTLGRRRLRSFTKSRAAKAYTFPRSSTSDDQGIPMWHLRHRSFVSSRKPSFLRSLGRVSSKRFPYPSEEGYDTTDELESCFTEEERREELSNIRNIPVRLSEKKKYRYYDGNMQEYRKTGNKIVSNQCNPSDFHRNAHTRINQEQVLRSKYEHDISFEDDGDLKRKVSHYSRYEKPSYIKASNLGKVGNYKKLSPVKGNIHISKSELSSANYEAAPTDDHLVYQSNMQPLQDVGIYSDERHGARRKDFSPSRRGHYNSGWDIESSKVDHDDYKSGNSYTSAAFKFSVTKDEMPYSIDDITHAKGERLNACRYGIVRKKDVPFYGKSYCNRALSIQYENIPSSNNRPYAIDELTQAKGDHSFPDRYYKAQKSYVSASKKAYYNRAFSIEDENISVFSKFPKERDLPSSRRSYHNSALSIDDESTHINHAEFPESYSYKRKSSTSNEGKSYIRDPTFKRRYREQFYVDDNINERKPVSDKNAGFYHGPNKSFDEIYKHEAGYCLSRFEDSQSQLDQEKYITERRNFVSAMQGRQSEIYKRHSTGYKGTGENRRTGIQNIKMEPIDHSPPKESLNMHDAFMIGNIMLAQEDGEPVSSDPQLLIISENEEGFNVSERQCWSKSCFSLLKHAHVSDQHDTKENALQNREAILETLPLHGPKDKSFWSKVKVSCTCLRRISSAFEIWNGTLKSIEGQQGTGVVSYFVFLRWLIALNMILLILYLLFVTLPHTVFAFMPLKEITVAPNHTVIDEKFLSQFPSPTKRTKLKTEKRNNSLKLSDIELLSNLGALLDEYLVENILDVTISYDKRNMTTKERHNISRYCESRYIAEMQNRTDGFLSVIQDLLQGTGWLQSTVLFLGHYSANEISYFGLPYHLPVAIIFVLFLSFVVCLGMMIQYSSHGVQETILARKSNYLAYSNLLFCSWDYCIEDKKSSIIRHSSILNEMKSTLNEDRRKRDVKEWSRGKKFRVYFLRGFINIFVVCILCGSYYLIYRVVNYQLMEQQLHRLNNPGVNTLFVQYLSPIVITCLNIFVPVVFTNIVKFEMYNTQTQINIALFRIVFLRLSSIFVLVGLLYQQITCEPKDMCGSGISATCHSPICWETYVGQQFYKLAVTDFFVYIILFIVYDFPRDVIVRRFDNKFTQLIGRQVFDLPNQVLALVYSQTLCWLGIIYSPLLPVITMIKFVILFHVKKIMVLRYCIPAPIPYKASRSNAMFMMILMLSFFTLLIIHGYSLSSIEPSAACSPFRHYFVMVEAVPDAVFSRSPTFASFINFFFSAIFLFPAILLMCIAIYYYWTLIVANRKMGKVLKAQIMLEGRDKQFLLNRLTEVAKGHI